MQESIFKGHNYYQQLLLLLSSHPLPPTCLQLLPLPSSHPLTIPTTYFPTTPPSPILPPSHNLPAKTPPSPILPPSLNPYHLLSYNSSLSHPPTRSIYLPTTPPSPTPLTIPPTYPLPHRLSIPLVHLYLLHPSLSSSLGSLPPSYYKLHIYYSSTSRRSYVL